MDIKDYKNVLDDIIVPEITVDDLERKIKKTKKKKTTMFMIASGLIVILAMIVMPVLVTGKDSFTIRVYAADGTERILAEAPMTYRLDMELYSLYEIEPGNVFVDTKMFFEIEGDDIESITISTGQNGIGSSDVFRVYEVDAYFVEYHSMNKVDYDKKREEIQGKKDLLRTLYGEGEAEIEIETLIGTSLMLKYEEQKQRQLGLCFNLSKNEDGTISLKENNLTVEVTFINGKKQTQEIKIAANDSLLENLELEISKM